MNKLQVAIIEDEVPAARLLHSMVSRWSGPIGCSSLQKSHKF